MSIYRLFGSEIEISRAEEARVRDRYLKHYVQLNEALKDTNEDDCLKALILEITGKDRVNMKYRLHYKFSELRAQRERKQHNIRKV
jgi:hypothetical protein